MEVVTINGRDHIALSYEEERNLAQSVMDCIAMRNVQGEFQNLLDRIYEWKCKTGFWPPVDDILSLLDYMQQYGIPEPVFYDDGTNIKSDLSPDVYPTPADREMESRKMVIMAWREVWERHPEHKAVSDYYASFPGDDQRLYLNEVQDTATEQEAIEAAFWEEVDRLIDTLQCSKVDAIRMASDYMMRAEF